MAEALKACGFEYSTVDVLSEPNIRQYLPAYSQRPTFRQIFIDGELIRAILLSTYFDAVSYKISRRFSAARYYRLSAVASTTSTCLRFPYQSIRYSIGGQPAQRHWVGLPEYPSAQILTR